MKKKYYHKGIKVIESKRDYKYALVWLNSLEKLGIRAVVACSSSLDCISRRYDSEFKKHFYFLVDCEGLSPYEACSYLNDLKIISLYVRD